MAGAGRSSTGCAWYVGVPGAGKTTLACSHLARDSRANGWPCLVLDSSDVAQLAHVPHVRSVAELERAVWQLGEHAAYIPQNGDDVERVAARALELRQVNLLVDEAAFWLSSHKGRDGSLLRLMRAHRHAQVRLYLTTQHLSADVPQAALSCAPELYVFRCTANVVLDRLEREYGMDRSLIANLPRGQYVRHVSGFSA